MTIHRGLSELKTIDARIEKAIESFSPVGIYQNGPDGHEVKVNNLKKKEEFEKDATSSYQSIIALIERKNKLKVAIVSSNAVTEVEIGKVKMTVADAITMKDQIQVKKKLIEQMKSKHRAAFSTMNKNNEAVDANAVKLAEVGLSKPGVKIGDNDAQTIIAPYLKAQKYHLSDVIDVGKEWAKLDAEISEFEVEVDATLSEINATTFIEV